MKSFLIALLGFALTVSTQAQTYTSAQKYALKQIAALRSQIAQIETKSKAPLVKKAADHRALANAKGKAGQDKMSDIRAAQDIEKQISAINKQIGEIELKIVNIQIQAKLPTEKKR